MTTTTYNQDPRAAAAEIWTAMKPTIQRMVSQAARSGRTYYFSTLRTFELGSKKLAFEFSAEDRAATIEALRGEITLSIADHTLNLNANVKSFI